MRMAALIAAAALAALLYAAPWRGAGVEPFTLHMLRHIGLVALVAPLLAIAFGPGRIGVSPLAATVAEFAVVWGWHLPRLHEAAAVSPFVLAIEQFSYLAVGLALWASVARAIALAGAGAMALTFMHMTLLGALLILAPRPLYTAVCFGPDPLSDQQLGGMLMLAVASPVYLAAGLWKLRQTLDGPASENAEETQ